VARLGITRRNTVAKDCMSTCARLRLDAIDAFGPSVIDSDWKPPEKGWTQTVGCLSGRHLWDDRGRFRKIAFRRRPGNYHGRRRPMPPPSTLAIREVAMMPKARVPRPYDPRGHERHGVGLATSKSWACHLRAYRRVAALNWVSLPFGSPQGSIRLAWQGKADW